MRALMGLSKDRHGTYYARRKVPERLQEVVARILDNGKVRQVWLKKSLGTKVLTQANVRAKPVLMQFDHVFAQAEAQLKERPIRTSLSAVEINRMAELAIPAPRNLTEPEMRKQVDVLRRRADAIDAMLAKRAEERPKALEKAARRHEEEAKKVGDGYAKLNAQRRSEEARRKAKLLFPDADDFWLPYYDPPSGNFDL